ncbi:MAG: hypothetical protein V7K41_29265 [Nostoc sp.]|uniref:hypothetical protein n=1 Tax=Nostoc sp. TaxID=1180 RepID=UPI002FF89365
MSGKMISDVYDGLRLRSANTKGERTSLHPKFHKCVAVRLVVRHRTLKVTNL